MNNIDREKMSTTSPLVLLVFPGWLSFSACWSNMSVGPGSPGGKLGRSSPSRSTVLLQWIPLLNTTFRGRNVRKNKIGKLQPEPDASPQ